MVAAQKLKASEKQALARKLTLLLKKEYKGSVPKDDRSVLDTILFAICLENSTHELAEAAFARIDELFHDLNEVRVSSISELAEAFQNQPDPEWRALRVRAVLQYVFEKHFAFDFDILRRKTQDVAAKQLGKIRDLSPFVRSYTLHEALGMHVIPLDDRQHRVVVWLGLAPTDSTLEQAAEELKPALRKAEAPLFGHLLRSFANDARFENELLQTTKRPPAEGFDPETGPERLAELVAGGGKKSKPTGKSDSKTNNRPPEKSTTTGKKTATKKSTKRSTAPRRKK